MHSGVVVEEGLQILRIIRRWAFPKAKCRFEKVDCSTFGSILEPLLEPELVRTELPNLMRDVGLLGLNVWVRNVGHGIVQVSCQVMRLGFDISLPSTMRDGLNDLVKALTHSFVICCAW